jgi:hypothetical protein
VGDCIAIVFQYIIFKISTGILGRTLNPKAKILHQRRMPIINKNKNT